MTSAFNAIFHSITKINQSKVINHPFPYLEIDDIFPDDFYRILLARVPSQKIFHVENENVLRLDLINDPAGGGEWPTVFDSRAPQKEKDFWNQFLEAYMGEEFISTLLNKFETFPEDDVYMCGRLCIDKLNSGLGPHTDRFDKVISLLYYIPSTNIVEKGCETILFEPKDSNLEATNEHYTFDEFNEVKRIEYRPNKLFVFKVQQNVDGAGSFHGYHQDADIDRPTIKTFIQLDLDPDYVREQVELTKHRSRRWRKEKELDNE